MLAQKVLGLLGASLTSLFPRILVLPTAELAPSPPRESLERGRAPGCSACPRSPPVAGQRRGKVPVTCHPSVPLRLGVGLPSEGQPCTAEMGEPRPGLPPHRGQARVGTAPAAALGAQKMLGFLISPAQPRLFYL